MSPCIPILFLWISLSLGSRVATRPPALVPWDYSVLCNCTALQSCPPTGVCSASDVGIKLLKEFKSLKRAATFFEKGMTGANKTLCKRRTAFEWAALADLDDQEEDFVPTCAFLRVDSKDVSACSLAPRNTTHLTQEELALKIGLYFKQFSCHTADQPSILSSMAYCNEDYCTAEVESTPVETTTRRRATTKNGRNGTNAGNLKSLSLFSAFLVPFLVVL